MYIYTCILKLEPHAIYMVIVSTCMGLVAGATIKGVLIPVDRTARKRRKRKGMTELIIKTGQLLQAVLRFGCTSTCAKEKRSLNECW